MFEYGNMSGDGYGMDMYAFVAGMGPPRIEYVRAMQCNANVIVADGVLGQW